MKFGNPGAKSQIKKENGGTKIAILDQKVFFPNRSDVNLPFLSFFVDEEYHNVQLLLSINKNENRTSSFSCNIMTLIRIHVKGRLNRKDVRNRHIRTFPKLCFLYM